MTGSASTITAAVFGARQKSRASAPAVRPSLKDWHPPPGVLDDYIAYWSPTTDAPREYHVPCGLTVLAGTLENRVYLPFGGDRLFPNTWALILGPSSFYRKSSTLAKARRTLMKLHVTDGQGPLLPDEFSREALLKRLSERAQGVLTYSEFSGAMAQFGRDYMSGTMQLLADLYDSPALYTRVVGQQTWTLKNCCISILAASQTDWFIDRVKQSDMRGGFLARFTFWPAFTKPGFLAVPPEPNSQLGWQLVARLNALRDLKGAARLSDDAQRHYTQWVERHEQELHGSPYIADLSPFWSRLSITTLKFALLLHVSERQDLTISRDAVVKAIELVGYLKTSLAALFAQDFAFTQPMKDRQKLLRLITDRPGIKRRDLMRASSMLVRTFDEVIRTLRAEESVEERDGGYYPADPSAMSAPVSDGPTDSRSDGFTESFS